MHVKHYLITNYSSKTVKLMYIRAAMNTDVDFRLHFTDNC
jgi:hypothetical protein